MEGLFATIGGILFFLSWVLQLWESKKAGSAVVSLNFFLLRLVASVLLIIEAVKLKSFGFLLVMICTVLMVLYNIRVCASRPMHKTKSLTSARLR
jgi:lipid-A-disaccharide synthase-like uncharacterized protein